MAGKRLSTDVALAADAIAAGRALEALWAAGRDPERALPASPVFDELLFSFRASVSRVCAGARDSDLILIAGRSAGVSSGASLRTLIAVLAPFERWAERPLRDDEFLVVEGDQSRSGPALAPLAGLLDNVRSAFNVGAMFRTAECAGFTRLALSGYTPTPADGKTKRTAMGCEELVPWRAFARFDDAAIDLRHDGYRLVALETTARAVDLHAFEWPERCALIVGNERFGLGAEALRAADDVIRIPMLGAKNSLNAGIAFAIAAFEFRRRRSAQGRP